MFFIWSSISLPDVDDGTLQFSHNLSVLLHSFWPVDTTRLSILTQNEQNDIVLMEKGAPHQPTAMSPCELKIELICYAFHFFFIILFACL